MQQAIGTEAFQKIAHTLLIRVDHRWNMQRLAEQAEAMGGNLPYGCWAEHFAFQFTAGESTNTNIQGVLQKNLDDWQITFKEACDVAVQNLARITHRNFGAYEVNEVAQCYESLWSEGDHAARVLLADMFKVKLEGKAIFFPVSHDKIFICSDESQYGMAVVAARLSESEKQYWLLPPFGIDQDLQAWPPPSHAMYPALREHQYKYMAHIYDEQRQYLTSLNENEGLVIAKQFIVRDKQNIHSTSAVVTQKAEETLLPKSDVVLFQKSAVTEDDKPKLVASASWEDVERILKGRLQPTPEYPPRYLFEGFPSDDELTLLNQAKSTSKGSIR